MRPCSGATALGLALGMLPTPAHAQYVPPWALAAALSPILVLVLCVVVGMVERSVRAGVLHAGVVLLWVALFALACYFVENDYVIWTPLALYVMHAVLLPVLIVVGIARRIARGAGTT